MSKFRYLILEHKPLDSSQDWQINPNALQPFKLRLKNRNKTECLHQRFQIRAVALVKGSACSLSTPTTLLKLGYQLKNLNETRKMGD